MLRPCNIWVPLLLTLTLRVNNTAKTLDITLECCPTTPDAAFTQNICPDDVDSDVVYLSEVLPCDGIVCGEDWVPSNAEAEAIYDACDQSVMVDVPEGCYEYTKSGSNVQCGAFSLTFTLCIACCPDDNGFFVSDSVILCACFKYD